MNSHHKILITAGITVVDRLARKNPASDIAIVEPCEKHY